MFTSATASINSWCIHIAICICSGPLLSSMVWPCTCIPSFLFTCSTHPTNARHAPTACQSCCHGASSQGRPHLWQGTGTGLLPQIYQGGCGQWVDHFWQWSFTLTPFTGWETTATEEKSWPGLFLLRWRYVHAHTCMLYRWYMYIHVHVTFR